MRILRKIFFYLFAIITMVLLLAFSFVEIRTLVSGDFGLDESPIQGALSHAFRALFFVLVLLILVSRMVGEAQKERGITLSFFIVYMAACFGVAASIFFYDWYVPAALVAGLILTLICSTFVRHIENQ